MPYDSPDPVANLQQFEEKVDLLKKEAIMDIGLWEFLIVKGWN